MISVVIPTLDSERVLVPTLSALVPGASAGLVREVVLADGGSSDDTERIGDIAGCRFLKEPADLGARLAAAAQAARGDWLLFLEPMSVLEEGWTREVGKFVGAAVRGAADAQAAAFRLALEDYGLRPRLVEALAAARLALTGRPHAEQGLLIAKRRYQELGGHAPGARAHARFLARLDRVAALRTRVIVLYS